MGYDGLLPFLVIDNALDIIDNDEKSNSWEILKRLVMWRMIKYCT
jgi:hypothetical protein